MMTTLHSLAIPTPEQMHVLDQFAGLAKARADLVRLHRLVPSPSLAVRLRAADHVLVRQYEDLIARGQGLEAAAVLALHRAPHVRLAAERRVA
jgi:hypothetical protein